MAEFWLVLNKVDLIYYSVGLLGTLMVFKLLISSLIFRKYNLSEVLPGITSYASGIIVSGVAIKLHLKFPIDIALIIGLTFECMVFIAFGWYAEIQLKDEKNKRNKDVKIKPISQDDPGKHQEDGNFEGNINFGQDKFQKRTVALLEKLELLNKEQLQYQKASVRETIITVRKEDLAASFDSLEDAFRSHLENLNKMNAIYFKSVEEMTESHFLSLHEKLNKEYES